MSKTVIITDKQLTGKVYGKSKLTFPESHITLKDLIIGRVLQETTEYNSLSLGKVFSGLVQPEEENIGMIDTEKQIAIALQGFHENRFFVLVNDKQVSDLNEVLTIDDDTQVSFIKLVPLIGG